MHDFAGLPISVLTLESQKQVTFAGLKSISCLSTLTDLSLAGCIQIQDSWLSCLSVLPLTTLSLDFCYQVTNEGLEFLKGLPLTSLDLSFNCSFFGDGLLPLAGMQLRTLYLDWGNDEPPYIGPGAVEVLKSLPLSCLRICMPNWDGEATTNVLMSLLGLKSVNAVRGLCSVSGACMHRMSEAGVQFRYIGGGNL